MIYVNPDVLEAVEGALECVRGMSAVSEEAVVRLTGFPATEVRAALHVIARRQATTRRSARIDAGPADPVSEFLRQYELVLFPFI